MVVRSDPYPDDFDFERFIALPENSDRMFELIHGEIVEKMLTEEKGILVLKIGSELLTFVQTHHFGRVGTHTLHHNPQDRLNYRLPDISFTADTTTPIVKEGAVPRFPDLAVEVITPSDSYRQMREKAAYYLANGVKLVWLFNPETLLVDVYRANGERLLIGESDVLDGGDVLPGFAMPVSDVFKT